MRIAILDDYQNAARSLADWDSLPGEATFFTEFLGHDDDAVCRALQDFDVIVAMRERTPFTADRLRSLPNLKLLVTTGMRNASIDLDAARELGITVCGTAGSPTAAAEHTWALILAAARRLDVELFSAVPAAPGLASRGSRPWAPGCRERPSESTAWATWAARSPGSAQAFGMRVIAHSQNLTTDRAAEVGVEWVDQDGLFAESDVLSIHLKLSERTTKVVGTEATGADETRIDPCQHLAKPHDRRGCAGCGPRHRRTALGGTRRVRRRTPARGQSAAADPRGDRHPARGLRDGRTVPDLLHRRGRGHRCVGGRAHP